MKTKGKSVTKRLVLFTSLAFIIQTALFIGIFEWSGVFKSINRTAISQYNRQVDNKSVSLEYYLSTRANLFAHSAREVNVDLNEEFAYNIKTASYEQQETVIIRAASNLFHQMRETQLDGVFIILENDGSNPSLGVNKMGLYLRNENESNFVFRDITQVSLICGTDNIATGIGKDGAIASNPYFPTGDRDERYNLFQKPIDAVNDATFINSNGDTYNYGYWTNRYDYRRNSWPVIAFSMPLVSDDGQAYGVVGLEFNCQNIKNNFLQYSNTNSEMKPENFTFLMAKGNSSQYFNGVTNGTLINEADIDFDSGKPTDNYFIYNSHKGKIISYSKELELYNRNAYYEDNQYSFAGLIRESALLNSIRGIKAHVIGSVVTINVIVYIIFLIILYYSIRPLKQFARLIDKASADDIENQLLDTDIRELKIMASRLSLLFRKKSEITKYTMSVLEKLERPVIIYYYDKESPFVNCSATISRIIDVGEVNSGFLRLDKVFILEHIEDLKREPFRDLRDVYRVDEHHFYQITEDVDSNGIVQGIIFDVSNEINRQTTLEKEKDLDLLTGLYSRSLFEDEMKKRLQTDKTSAVVIFDLDGLKKTNDAYGHSIGDEYICAFADLLRKYAPEDSLSSRRSGDEFLLYISNPKNKDDITTLLDKMRAEALTTQIHLSNGIPVFVRYSAGVSFYPSDSNKMDNLLKYADYAMYKVKRMAKGTIGIFDAQTYIASTNMVSPSVEFNRIVSQERVIYAFQPIVSTHDASIGAYEALMTIQSDIITNPLDLIDIARFIGKLDLIEELTLSMSVRAIYKNNTYLKGKEIFINMEPNALFNEQLVDRLNTQYKDVFKQLVYEMLEEEELYPQNLQKKLAIINQYSGKKALVKFGTGFNMDLMAVRMDIDYVKIDASIIMNCHVDENRQDLIKQIVEAAKKRHCQVIAEGVETSHDLEKVIELGVDYVQGYYIARSDFEIIDISNKTRREILSIRSRVIN